jgi:hypothetical protein
MFHDKLCTIFKFMCIELVYKQHISDAIQYYFKNIKLCFTFSSPEHSVLMVIFCDLFLSVVRRPLCVVRSPLCGVNNALLTL